MTIQFSHGDLDGLMCLMLGEMIGVSQYKFLQYSTMTSKQWDTIAAKLQSTDHKQVLLTDLNLTESIINILTNANKDKTFLFVDHHETSTFTKRANLKVVINTSIAACKILSQIVSKKVDISKYINVIDAASAFDTWHLEQSNLAISLGRVFHKYMYMSSYSDITTKLISFMNLIKTNPPTNQHIPLWFRSNLTQYTNQIKYRLSKITSQSKLHNGVRIYFLGTNNLQIPIFELVLHSNQNNEYNLAFIFQKQNSMYVSLRTNSDNVDCSKLCKEHGGGGHKRAAGFQSNSKEEVINTINSFSYQLNHH
jgi:oligoribonuclease NrnB/cAMP/cGMP phosphodiesterase (DHH superfamily)